MSAQKESASKVNRTAHAPTRAALGETPGLNLPAGSGQRGSSSGELVGAAPMERAPSAPASNLAAGPGGRPPLAVASKYGGAREQASRHLDRNTKHQTPNTKAPVLFIPTISGARQRLTLRDWYWREIKEGGFLERYLRAEKAKTPAMIRTVARMMSGFEQNNRSDLRRLAAIPARTYHRWKEEDEHFFDDDDNLRSLKRDNPDMAIYVGPKRVKGRRYRYGK